MCMFNVWNRDFFSLRWLIWDVCFCQNDIILFNLLFLMKCVVFNCLRKRASLQILFIYQYNCFRNWATRNKNCLHWPCLLTDRNKMSNLNRGPSIDAYYQVSIHFAKLFQRRRHLGIEQSETWIAYGGHHVQYETIEFISF
jgi:hypothetical protein